MKSANINHLLKYKGDLTTLDLLKLLELLDIDAMKFDNSLYSIICPNCNDDKVTGQVIKTEGDYPSYKCGNDKCDGYDIFHLMDSIPVDDIDAICSRNYIKETDGEDDGKELAANTVAVKIIIFIMPAHFHRL